MQRQSTNVVVETGFYLQPSQYDMIILLAGGAYCGVSNISTGNS